MFAIYHRRDLAEFFSGYCWKNQLKTIFWFVFACSFAIFALSWSKFGKVHRVSQKKSSLGVLVTEETIFVQFLGSSCHSKALYFSYFMV